MSILWTDVPLDYVYQGMYNELAPFIEIQRGGITMLVTPEDNGMGRIERIISPNPQHYLRPDLAPGSLVSLNQ